MEATCRTYVSTCFACQLEAARYSPGGWRGEMIPPPPGPRLEWSLDLIENLPRSGAYQHILTSMDTFLKYVVFTPLPDKTSRTVCNAFQEHVIAVFGIPLFIRSDNGAAFAGDFDMLASIYNITHRTTSTHHSNANG